MSTTVYINTAGVGLATREHVFKFFYGLKSGGGLSQFFKNGCEFYILTTSRATFSVQ